MVWHFYLSLSQVDLVIHMYLDTYIFIYLHMSIDKKFSHLALGTDYSPFYQTELILASIWQIWWAAESAKWQYRAVLYENPLKWFGG